MKHCVYFTNKHFVLINRMNLKERKCIYLWIILCQVNIYVTSAQQGHCQRSPSVALYRC